MSVEWGTSAENKADMVRHGTRMVGERHPNAKLNKGDVSEIRRRLSRGESQGEIAASYGVGKGQISRINTAARWANA